jgi:hypothetical protein
MSSKRIEIFKKASNSQKISLKSHAFLKKSLAFSKKSLTAIAVLPQRPFTENSKYLQKPTRNP